MRTIAVLNQKGGVGKTTTVANTGAALAGMGCRVMVIDFDPQAHLTIHMGVEPEAISGGSYGVLAQSQPVEEEIMLSRLNLWLLPANIDLVGAETELVTVVGRETILREALESVADKFDYCLIDCPPSLGLLTLNALAAAQEVLIPLQPHFLALQGFGKLLHTVELVNKRINPELKVKGVVLCMYDTRTSLSNEVKVDIEQFLENAKNTDCAWAEAEILPTYIRRNIKLAEAPSYGKTIYEYERNCHGAEDYFQVACHIHGIEMVDPSQRLHAQQDESHGQEETPRENESDKFEPKEIPEGFAEVDGQTYADMISEAYLAGSEPFHVDVVPPDDPAQKTAGPYEIRSMPTRRRKIRPEPAPERNIEHSTEPSENDHAEG